MQEVGVQDPDRTDTQGLKITALDSEIGGMYEISFKKKIVNCLMQSDQSPLKCCKSAMSAIEIHHSFIH